MQSLSLSPQLDRRSQEMFTRVRLGCIASVLALALLATLADTGLSRVALLISAAWFALVPVQHLFLRQARHAVSAERQIAAMLSIDAIIVAILVGFTGGVWWCAPVMYTMITTEASVILPRRHALWFSVVATVALAAVYSALASGLVEQSKFLGVPSMLGAWGAVVASLVIAATQMVSLGWIHQVLTSAIRQRAARYRALMDTASDLFVVLTSAGEILNVNRATLALARCERAEILQGGIERLLVAEDAAFFRGKLPRAMSGEQQTMMLRAPAYHGVRWLSCTLAPMSPGMPESQLLAIFRDVTDERLIADTVRNSEASLRAVFDQAAIAIALLDVDGTIVEVNPAVQRLLGYDGAGLIGRRWNIFAPPEDLVQTTEFIDALCDHSRINLTSEQRFVRSDGRVLWTMLTITRVDSPTGADRLIAMLQDITERRALESQLTWQAFHDPLTNLANRTLFRERVDRALNLPTAASGSVAVLFLDLDNFKTVNDSMGHAAGDQLLFEIGRRLLNATRGCDTVARLGGDEFAVLMDNVHNSAECVAIAERILQTMEQPVELDGAEVTVGTSIGIVRSADGDSADDVLRNADVAMYNAKQRGKGRHSLFEPIMHDRAVERLRLETDLRAAIEADEITLVFQPIVAIHSGKPCGLEALARWTHPEFGDVSPAIFIPLAEETGMIVPLGSRILRRACEEASQWNAIPGLSEAIGISVNVSGRQLEEPALVAHVRDALQLSGLDPACLTLEITESALVQNSAVMRERLLALKDLGISLAIDDFGTGYSSLSYIQQFPVDTLKIDRSFVDGLGQSGSTDAALARTIIALGASLQLRTVAEGIENESQRIILRELGCEFGQGFLYSRPLTSTDARQWLSQALNVQLPSGRPHSAPPRSVKRARRDTGERALISA
jgi:diguanylate cyclase (GGDEF)-like protein/PAS domain S-box-containing protein